MGGGHKARGHTNGPSHADPKQSRQQRGRGSRQHAGGATRDGLPPPVPLGEAVDAATSRTNHLLGHLRTHHNAVAARGVVMPTGLCMYLAYSLIACNLGAYGFNFHYYNFPAIMWNCLKLSRPLLMITVMHSRSDLAAAIRSPAVVFKVAIVASIGLLYLWFTFLLSTSLWRLACIALPEAVVIASWIAAHRTRTAAAAMGVCLRTADEFSDHAALMVVEAVDHGYCVSLLPYFLMESNVVYVDHFRVAVVFAITAATSFAHQLSNYLTVHGPRLVALADQLGSWQRVSSPAPTQRQGHVEEWVAGTVYARGSVVAVDSVQYRAMSRENAAHPHGFTARVLKFVCGQPARTHACIVSVLYGAIVVELCLASASVSWPFYLLLLAGNLFAFATCSLGLRSVEQVYDRGFLGKVAAAPAPVVGGEPT